MSVEKEREETKKIFVNLVLFAQLRELAEFKERQFSVTPPITIQQFLDILYTKVGKKLRKELFLHKDKGSVMTSERKTSQKYNIVYNGAEVSTNDLSKHFLSDNDTIYILPPVSGGDL